MHTKDAVINDGRKTQVIKNLAAISPHIGGAELLETFVVETIDLGDLSRLMVASDKSDSIRVSDLVGGMMLFNDMRSFLIQLRAHTCTLMIVELVS